MNKRLLLAFGALAAVTAGWASTTFPLTLAIPDSATMAAQWTVVDANAATSPNTWTYSNQAAKYTEDKKNAADDWLITPAVELEAGATYKVSFYLKHGGLRFDKQKFAITAGTAATVEAQTTTLLTNESYNGSLYSAQTGAFTPAASGSYHFAVHVYSASYNGDLYCQKVVVEKAVTYPAHVSGLTATARPKGELKATVKWTMPSKDNYGNPLSQLSGARVSRNGTVVATLDGTPGQEMEYTDASIERAGSYTYQVTAFSASGDAQGTAPSVKLAWVGRDTPKAVTGLKATASGDKVLLTFTPCDSVGVNGGYVDSAAVTYRIARNSTVIEEAWRGQQPYTDGSVPGLGKYTYEVTPTFDGNKGATASVSIKAGGSLGVPYSETFDTKDNFDLFTTLDPNNSGRTWTYNSSKKAAQYWGGTAPVDQWLLTPSIKMEAGKTYQLTFKTGLESALARDYKDLYVTVGNAATVEAQTTQIYHENIQSALMEGKTAYFTVPASGDYNVGFRCSGATSYNAIFVDNIAIVESKVIPEAVADLAVKPQAAGALRADITFTLPSKDKAGNQLGKISSYTVLRADTTVVAQSATVKPGDAVTVTDTVPSAGFYTYKVTVTTDGQSSTSTGVKSAWVGCDTPVAPARATLASAEGKPQVTFAPVGATGVNGGYVDSAAVRYRIVRNPGSVEVAAGIADTTFTDNSTLPLASYTYSIQATAGSLTGEAATTNGLVFGDALELPYTTDLGTADEAAIWSVADANGDGKTWTYSAKNGDFEYTSMRKADDYLFTPPFKTVAGLHRLTVSVRGYNYRYSDQFDVVLTTSANPADSAQFTTIKSFAANSLQSSMFDSKEISFDVPASGTYHIGIHDVSTDSWGLYVKDTKIELVTATGVSSVEAAAAVRYVAPSATLVVAQPSQVRVYSASGSLVYSGKVSGSVSLASLPAGVYVATADAGGSNAQHVKFVK